MNHQQLLNHIIRVFPNWYVGMYFSWVRPLWLSALQLFCCTLNSQMTFSGAEDREKLYIIIWGEESRNIYFFFLKGEQEHGILRRGRQSGVGLSVALHLFSSEQDHGTLCPSLPCFRKYTYLLPVIVAMTLSMVYKYSVS